MQKLIAYSAISTKIRAMQGKLLTDSDFKEIAESSSVTETLTVLEKHSPYANAFQGTDPETLHRKDIERILLTQKYSDFAKLYRFANTKQRKFLELYFMHYEIAILKRALRACFNQKNIDIDLRGSIDFFRKHSHLDMDALLAAQTLSEFIEAIKGSSYYDDLNKLFQQEGTTLFDYELHIDQLYFKRIWTLKDKYLGKSERQFLTATFGSRMDMLNLQWIYRSKRYYHLDNNYIYSLLIPLYYKLHAPEIKALVEAGTQEEFEAVLQSTYYGKLEAKLFTDNFDLEKLYSAVLSKIYQMTAKNNPYSIALINSYLFHKEGEINRIVSTIEAVRYGLPADQIMSDILKQNSRRSSE
jgi:ATP synthase, subunit C